MFPAAAVVALRVRDFAFRARAQARRTSRLSRRRYAFVLSSRTRNCKRDAGPCGWLPKYRHSAHNRAPNMKSGW